MSGFQNFSNQDQNQGTHNVFQTDSVYLDHRTKSACFSQNGGVSEFISDIRSYAVLGDDPIINPERVDQPTTLEKGSMPTITLKQALEPTEKVEKSPGKSVMFWKLRRKAHRVLH